MKTMPYIYQTKYGEKRVESAIMFDTNKTIMRLLVKNLALLDLGLYSLNIYIYMLENTCQNR